MNLFLYEGLLCIYLWHRYKPSIHLMESTVMSVDSDYFHHLKQPLGKLQKFCFEKLNYRFSRLLLQSVMALFLLQSTFAFPFPPFVSHICYTGYGISPTLDFFYLCVLLLTLTPFSLGCICSVVPVLLCFPTVLLVILHFLFQIYVYL